LLEEWLIDLPGLGFRARSRQCDSLDKLTSTAVKAFERSTNYKHELERYKRLSTAGRDEIDVLRRSKRLIGLTSFSKLT
jgi:hypothetical protein